jgi:hypothetical protein
MLCFLIWIFSASNPRDCCVSGSSFWWWWLWVEKNRDQRMIWWLLALCDGGGWSELVAASVLKLGERRRTI